MTIPSREIRARFAGKYTASCIFVKIILKFIVHEKGIDGWKI
jgi:hypothetical protein